MKRTLDGYYKNGGKKNDRVRISTPFPTFCTVVGDCPHFLKFPYQHWCESSGIFWPKIMSPPFLAALMKICIKHKNVFLSETVQDRVVLAPGVYTGIWPFLSTIVFPPKILVAILNFCIKCKNAFFLETL